MSDVTLSIVRNCLLGFNIIGTFGNLNIIYATLKHKRFHHKCGIILGFLAFCDLICLWYEFQSFIRISFGLTEASLTSCFWANSGYVFMEVLEVYTIFALAVDRQIAISLPMKFVFSRYRLLGHKHYILAILMPGVVIGFIFLISSLLLLTDEIRNVCVLPYAMPDGVSRIWNYYNMVFAILTVIMYAFTYVELYLFKTLRIDATQKKIQKAILSTVIVQAVIFFFSSVLSALIILLVEALGYAQLAEDASTLAVIPGLVSYSCNFYVYFWRSAEYRGVFMSQIFCGRVLVQQQSLSQNSQASGVRQTVATGRTSARIV